MRKIICLFLLLAMLFASFTGCVRVVDRPTDTNLEFWITENVTDYDFSEYTYVPGWGIWKYYGKDYPPVAVTVEGYPVAPEHCVFYTVGSYPDGSSKGKHITCIEITDPAVTFYGITLESTDEQIIAAMEKHGYTHLPEEQGEFGIRLYFENGNISFAFYEDEIVIGAARTKKNNHQTLY